jgi:nitrite reductase/ring-hydroxylating ferredoxin subunit
MSSDQTTLTGPDLEKGISLSEVRDGEMLAGHALGKPILLARRGNEIFAIGGTCTHYSAPLVDGLFVGETVHCPWHHACFNRTARRHGLRDRREAPR